MTTCPATLAIYSIKFLVFNFYGSDYLALKNGHRCENNPVLGHGLCSIISPLRVLV